jgi:ferredoxin
MKKNILSILILIITTNAIFCQKSENLNKSKNTRVIEAYGFIVGQEYTLNKIVKDYPHLKADVLIVQMNFNQIFSKSKIGLETCVGAGACKKYCYASAGIYDFPLLKC